MHPWLPLLLADITAAQRNEIPVAATEQPMTFEEEMEEIEKWVEGEEPDYTFGYYCGLEGVNFPPPHQLTDEEMKQVLKTFGEMMFSWNLDISLPELLPLPIRYTMTIDTLNTKTAIVNSGMMVFDFCTGYAPDCVFKEYCSCLEIWNSEEKENDIDNHIDNMDTDPNELPF